MTGYMVGGSPPVDYKELFFSLFSPNSAHGARRCTMRTKIETQKISADSYASDAGSAVMKAKELLGIL